MEEIGRRLRQKRLEKNLSIEDVNVKTRIPVKYIQAMEEGNLSGFSAEVYYTGSLRHYAHFLGLDENELMALYHARKQAMVPPAPPQSDSFWKKTEKKVVFIALISAAVLATAGIIIGNHVKKQAGIAEKNGPVQAPTVLPESPVQSTPSFQPPAKSTIPVTSPKAGSMRTVPATGSGVTAGTTDHQSNQGEGLSLEVRTTSDSWLRITADNIQIYEGILPAGNTQRWTAHGKIDIIIGYVPGVEATLNGRPVNVRQGAVKDVNQITLTRETLQNR